MLFSDNDFKFLNIENKINPRTRLNSNDFQKYSKILNNLLSISSRGDQAVFTKLNSLNKDLIELVNIDDIHKIFSKNTFKIKLEKNKNSKKSNLYSLNDDEALFLTKWKRYIKQVNETFEQTNMWPLFIGTYILKGRPGDKTIYAPLVLKEVEIIIENNDVYLVSKNSSVLLNEKLMFLIEEYQGIVIPNIKDDEDKITIDEIFSELNRFLKNSIDFEMNSEEEGFRSLNSTEINNIKITRTSGSILLFAQPLGGVLRNAVIDLIKEDRMNNLIKTNIDNVLSSEDESIKNIVYKPLGIARICPTDPSQENAIISSLTNNTIIIGPPGTGKSQTISNIIANILLNNKKALFISQKRVALEVVLERMKSLQFFTLQLVDHKTKNNDSKQMFYNYMENFVNLIKQANVNQFSTNDINLKPLMSYKKLEYLKSKNIPNMTPDDINLYSDLKKSNVKITKEMTNSFSNVINSLKQMSRFDQIDNIIKLRERKLKIFAQKLDVPPKFSFLGIKKYDRSFKKFFDQNLELLNLINDYNINDENIIKLKDYQNFNNLVELENAYKLHSEEIPKTNKFHSDENLIANVCAIRAQQIYRNIHSKDPKWVSKFTGRIQRKFTQPSKFVSLFKNELKQLFNVYVSTPEALSSFIDFKKDRFDYVIFDEASQIFLEKAIPYISIADKIIVAGDDQQMQPTNWFGSRSNVDEDEQEEENIDSLLTYAIENGINKEMLELNYRSSSAVLTSFSSKEFYEYNLKTLDNNEKLDKAIEIINVNGKWENKQNLIEANKVIEVLKNNLNKYKKIIILTLNKTQADLIDNKLSNEEPEIYNKIIDGDIILKNLENIQGDEADLVIVSIAYTKDAALSGTYVGRPGGRNALNVAITRAKNKMIIIKSLSSQDIQTKSEMNKDLRTFKNWVEFLELNEQDQKTYSLIEEKNSVNDIESGFELEVVQWLKTLSYNRKMKLSVQYPIGSYRIDVALLDSLNDKFIVGIEVDGFFYHSTIRQRYNDLVRQNFIESKGYRLIRISELLWKTNKEKIKNMLMESINNN